MPVPQTARRGPAHERKTESGKETGTRGSRYFFGTAAYDDKVQFSRCKGPKVSACGTAYPLAGAHHRMLHKTAPRRWFVTEWQVPRDAPALKPRHATAKRP